MTYLERSENGFFDISNSIKLEDLLESDINDYLISPLQVFSNFDVVNIIKNECKDLLDGKKINKQISKTSFVICDNNLIGIAKENEYLKLETYLGD
jgi:hypothetical protein